MFGPVDTAALAATMHTVRQATARRSPLHEGWAAAGFDPDYGRFTGHADDPRTDVDDLTLSLDDIEGDVRDEFEADGYRLAWWLNNDAGIDEPGACSLFEVKGRAPSDLTSGELLVRLLNGTDPAAIELLSRFRTHAAAEVAREAGARHAAQFAGEGL